MGSMRCAVLLALLCLFISSSISQQCSGASWGNTSGSFRTRDALSGVPAFPASTNFSTQNYQGGSSLLLHCKPLVTNGPIACAGWRSSQLVPYGDFIFSFTLPPPKTNVDIQYLRPTLSFGIASPTNVPPSTFTTFEMSFIDKNTADGQTDIFFDVYGPSSFATLSAVSIFPGNYTITLAWRNLQLAVLLDSADQCAVLIDLADYTGIVFSTRGVRLYAYNYFDELIPGDADLRDPNFVHPIASISYVCNETDVVCNTVPPQTTPPLTTSTATPTTPPNSLTTSLVPIPTTTTPSTPSPTAPTTPSATTPTAPPTTSSSSSSSSSSTSSSTATTSSGVPIRTTTAPPFTTADCGSDVPQTLSAVPYCLNGVWIIDPQPKQTVAFSAPLILMDASIEVRGDVKLSSTNEIRITDGKSFSVTGNLILDGDLLLDLNRHNASLGLPKLVKFSFASSSGNFSSVRVERDPNVCPHYIGKFQENSTNALTISFTTVKCANSSGPAAWVYILVVILVIILIAALLIGAFFLWRKSMRDSSAARKGSGDDGKSFLLKPKKTSDDETSDLSYSLLPDPEA